MAGYLHSRKPPGHIPLRKRGEEHLAEMFPEASSSAVAWSGSIGAIQFWLAALFVWCTRERRRETAKATPQRQPVSKHLGWLQTSAPRMHFIIVNLDVFCEKEREGIVRTGVVCTQPTAQKTFLSTGFSRPPSAIRHLSVFTKICTETAAHDRWPELFSSTSLLLTQMPQATDHGGPHL